MLALILAQTIGLSIFITPDEDAIIDERYEALAEETLGRYGY